ncbi:MAG: hypothetical protein EOP10_20965 [Proteobacteria bacterium]|nr:MAG: hypothetical protein EOP10_20965 [Pseudomonadota bacterium]
MNSNKRARLSFYKFFVASSFAWLISCGVEIGNPTKPAPNLTAEEQETLALVSAEQLEEAVAASSENHGGGLDDGMGLLPLANRRCSVQSDGSVLLSSENSANSSLDLPRKNPSRRVASTTQVTTSATLKTSDSGLACRAGGRLPSFDWSSLSLFESEVQSTRRSDRSLSALPSSNLLETVVVNAEGTRQVTWRRDTVTEEAVTLSKTINFQSTVNRTSIKNSVESRYVSKVETTEAIVVKQGWTGLRLNSFEILSGSVMSDYKDAQKLVVTYTNIEFIKGSSCYPQSGTLAAAIYPQDELNNPVLSYSIVFDAGEASLVFNDGSSKALDLADCAIGSN